MKVIVNRWQFLASAQHGAIAYAQLLAAGVSPGQVRERAAAGELTRIMRGVYRVTGSPPTFEQATMAACLATGGVASHRCAAALWALRGCETGLVEISVVGRRRPELPGVVAHTTGQLEAVDVTKRGSIPVTTPARTLLDLGAVAPVDVVEAAIEDALHRQLVSYSWLDRSLERTGESGRDGAGVLRSVLATRASGQAPTESPLEDALVRLLRRAGLPNPVRQHWITVPGRAPVRLDLAYPEERLAIEVQGMAWHIGRADFQRDCEKRNLLASAEWRLLEFTAEDIRGAPGQTVDAVAAALTAAAPRAVKLA